MTKEEKEKLIDSFEKLKYIPTLSETCTEYENGINEGISLCIEGIKNFGCGDVPQNQIEKQCNLDKFQNGLDELLEKYQMWLLDEEDFLESNKELAKRAINLNEISKSQTHTKCANLNKARIYVLKHIVDDLESLIGKQ